MKKISLVIFIVSVFIILWMGNNLFAQPPQDEKNEVKDKVGAIQFSIWNKIQLLNPDTSIYLLRLNAVYGNNKNVYGLDMGFAGRVESNFKGWQLNLLNLVKEDCAGLQTGLYNSSGDSKSIQIGIINTAKKMVGWQIGIINHSDDINGLQVGLLYNTAEVMKGLQIGLFNMNWKGKPLTFLPIINFSF